MAQIKKIADGKYLVRVSKGTGKARVYVNRTFRGTLAKAREFARDQETLLDSGLRSSLTFGEYRKVWLGAIKEQVAPLTYDNYEGNLRRHADPLNALFLYDIKTHHIQTIYNELTPAVVRNLHSTFHALLEHAIKKECLRFNPCKNTDRPKKRKPSIVVFDPDEARTFLERSREDIKNLVFEYALRTGMRPEEYLASRWSDLHEKDVSIEQVVQYNRKGGGFYFKEPKTAKSRRRVPIPADLRQRLTAHRRAQNEHRLRMKGTWANHNLIFPNEVGNPQTIPNLTKRLFVPLLDGHEKHLTLYSLRHTFATLMLIAGVHIKIVSEWLGHASVVLTIDTYSHVLPGMFENATEAFDELLRAKG